MDIVERAKKTNLCHSGCNAEKLEDCVCSLVIDMTNEIERLREALKRIADYEGGPVDLIWLGMAEIARSALQQKESE